MMPTSRQRAGTIVASDVVDLPSGGAARPRAAQSIEMNGTRRVPVTATLVSNVAARAEQSVRDSRR
jgi:hypothetical protein